MFHHVVSSDLTARVRQAHGDVQERIARDVNRVLRGVSYMTRFLIWQMIPRPLSASSASQAFALTRQFGGEA